jgi:PIN domain nuclease of toxin-antitoxin system
VKVLTDTHTLVWTLTGAAPLGTAAQAALAGLPFTTSVANLWELVMKARKPDALVGYPLPWWEKYVRGPRIPTLIIRAGHIKSLGACQICTSIRLTESW